MQEGLRVGQIVECVPLTLGPDPAEMAGKKTRNKRGKISYIHPLGRYVTVEMETTGGPLRESFHPEEVVPVKREAPKASKKKRRK